MGNASPSASFLVRHEFLIRRLHSLSGLIPVGAFLVVHLVTNASVLAGAETFQASVDRIHGLGPLLVPVEWIFIFIPILFHALFGIVIIRGGLPNTGQYPLCGNVRYTLQRATGMIAFVFILAHLWHMHHLGSYLGGGFFEPERASSTAGAALQVGLWVQLLYAVGVLASVFHLANGLWTMGITWGVWITPAAQKRADRVCMGFGAALAVVGLSALFGMGRVNLDEARAIEDVRHEEKAAHERRIQERRDELRGAGVSPTAEKTPAATPSAE